MVNPDLNDFSAEEINILLTELVESGKLSGRDAAKIILDRKREEVLAKHKKEHSIWEWRGKWYTCLKDATGKKITRKRGSLEEMADFLIDFYEQAEKRVCMKDVFDSWLADKLRFGDIQQQSYDRYRTDYVRFFGDDCKLAKTPVGAITAAMIETHIRETIKELGLSRKSYSGMITILRGVFKRARKEGLTELSITQALEEIEIPRKAFTESVKDPESEVFREDEIPLVTRYLQENPDPWNLALLLQFQTGMRVGEIVALRWCDVDGDIIHIRSTEIKYRGENGRWTYTVQEHPKTAAGRRDIVLPPQARDTIKQARRLNPFGGYVFLSRGRRMRGSALNRHCGLVCDRLRLPRRSTHKIRKTYGTTLLDARVDDALVAAQMGHKDVATTRKLYYYVNASEDSKRRQIAEAITY